MLPGQFYIAIDLINKEKKKNPDYMINQTLKESSEICIIENNNTWEKKKSN